MEDKSIRKQWNWVPSLYFAEGLPYAIVMMVAVVMYKRLGLNNTQIAFYTSWLYLPWVLKAIWSPFVELFSTRRRWVIVMQLSIALAFAAIAWSLGVSAFLTLSLISFWVLAFFSATHDIAADGFYMLALDKERQAWWVGLRSTFYRIALVLGQGGVVVFTGYMESRFGLRTAWRISYGLLSIMFLFIALWHRHSLPYPEDDHKMSSRSLSVTLKEFLATFIDFFRKPGIILAIAFIFLYRFPEAMLVKLISPFLLDSPVQGGIGLNTAEVGIVYGAVGLIGLLSGGILGGFDSSRRGLKRCIFPMAVAMSMSCVTVFILSLVNNPSFIMVNCCIAIEQFGYGYGLTAFTLYLLYFSDGPRRTAYYAICTGLMALGMMIPGMIAGWLQSLLGYRLFFGSVCCSCVLTIVLALIARKRLKE